MLHTIYVIYCNLFTSGNRLVSLRNCPPPNQNNFRLPDATTRSSFMTWITPAAVDRFWGKVHCEESLGLELISLAPKLSKIGRNNPKTYCCCCSCCSSCSSSSCCCCCCCCCWCCCCGGCGVGRGRHGRRGRRGRR